MDLPDVSVTWVISVSATVLLLTYFWFSRPNPKYPPCPLRPWPIVGNLLQLNPDPREQMVGFRKQCGNIYSLTLGSSRVVILNELEAAKDAFVKQGDDFSDRTTNYLDIVVTGANKGIITSNGANWKEHRVFLTAVLRSFGLGKNILTGKIQEEVSHFIEHLESFNGEPKEIQHFTTVSVSNIMCSIIVGQRYEYDDKQFKRMLEIMEFNLSKLKGTAVLNFFPWLRFLPGDLFYCKIIEKNFRDFFNIFSSYHLKENEDVVGEPGNFIAAYLQEMKRKETTGEQTYLDKSNLMRLIFDLFIAGTETTATTLGWFFLYMVNYPDVQERIFKEIDQVVGLERTPDMQDKAKLIYLTATIMEVQRRASLIPLLPPRTVPRDVYLHGYFIPKGTSIIVNFDSILHDPALWGADAAAFRPDRFIGKDGSIISPEAWIPFSFGRRVCLGESFARMELFLFVTNILQRFLILPADSETIPPVEGHLGVTYTPHPHNFRFVCRRTISKEFSKESRVP